MSQAEAFHILDMRLPYAVPLLASWWWRALFAGISIGLLPLLVVLWHFTDVPLGEWMRAHWPGLFSSAHVLGAPEAWLLASAAAYLAAAALRERGRARWAFLFLINISAAVIVCLLLDGVAELAQMFFARGASAMWSHLAPSPRCATVAAAAITCWSRWPSTRWMCVTATVLVMASQITLGSFFASDALAGVWIGVLTATVIPWVWWLAHPASMPGSQLVQQQAFNLFEK